MDDRDSLLVQRVRAASLASICCTIISLIVYKTSLKQGDVNETLFTVLATMASLAAAECAFARKHKFANVLQCPELRWYAQFGAILTVASALSMVFATFHSLFAALATAAIFSGVTTFLRQIVVAGKKPAEPRSKKPADTKPVHECNASD